MHVTRRAAQEGAAAVVDAVASVTLLGGTAGGALHVLAGGGVDHQRGCARREAARSQRNRSFAPVLVGDHRGRERAGQSCRASGDAAQDRRCCAPGERHARSRWIGAGVNARGRAVQRLVELARVHARHRRASGRGVRAAPTDGTSDERQR